MTCAYGAVYRVYATDGELLYVGVSQNVKRRLEAHARESAWWDQMDRFERDAYIPIDRAAISEADQIELLKPRFNKTGGAVTRRKDSSTREQWEAWREQYENGATIEELALDNGLGPATIRRHLLEVDTRMRQAAPQAGPRKKPSPRKTASDSPAVVHVVFAGTRGSHRRRGAKRAA